jgi:hypothetical protein
MTTTQEQQTHWRKVFNSDYLGSCDIDEGKDLKVTILSVEVKKVKDPQGKESERNVATFTDKAVKPMILNATNCRVIKKFAGTPYIEHWKNIPISVYVQGDIKAFGEVTEGLRIRTTQPKTAITELTPSNKVVWENAVKHYKAKQSTESIKEKYKLSEENEKKLIAEASK